MGACDFWTTGRGSTAQRAFNAAVDHAQYEYGHGGYTGTIAEKGGFKDLTGVYKLADAKRMLRERIAAAKVEMKGLPRKDYRRADLKCRIEEYRGALEAARRKPLDKFDRVYRLAHALFALGFGDDKWGPAMCLRVERGRYLFFGMASS